MSALFRILSRCVLPQHLSDHSPDPSSPHRRRFTRSYRRKRGLVKNLWMGAGLVILLQPTLAFLITVTLAMTFLAFVVLDETP